MFFAVNPLSAFALEEIDDVITDEEEQEIELVPSEPKFEEKAIPLKIEKTDIVEIVKPKKKFKEAFKNLGEQDGTALDLFRTSGYDFEAGPVKNQKLGVFFHGANVFNAQRGEDLSNTTDFTAAELYGETLFKDEKTSFGFSYNFAREFIYNNNFFSRFSSMYFQHRFNDNQKLMLGEMRVPNGIEGGITTARIRFFKRSQIARTFGNGTSNGIRNTAQYKYGSYDIGYFDGSRYWNNMFSGNEIAGTITLNPFENTSKKFGNLKVGGSFNVGNSANSIAVFGGHAIYNYKKLYLDFEYQHADGYSGSYYGTGRHHGFYTTASYFVLPKLELAARYDFLQNLNNENVSQEYVAGVNYHLNNKAKLMFNYVFSTKDTAVNPSHRIYLGADFFTPALLDLL